LCGAKQDPYGARGGSAADVSNHDKNRGTGMVT